MGGFMFNGCGAADSYYLLKPLPGHTCRSCRKKDYALMELKRKIRVLYVPTVSLNTKYAVVCPKCKEGYYVSEAQKDYILRNDPSCVEVVSDGVVIHGFADSQTERVIDTEAAAGTYAQPEREPEGEYCSQCGALLTPSAIFCAQCGTKRNTNPSPITVTEENIPAEKTVEKTETVSETEIKTVDDLTVTVNSSHKESIDAGNLSSARDKFRYNYQRGKVCPDCGMRSVPGKERCSICGAKL